MNDAREVRIVIVVAREIERAAHRNDPDRRIILENYLDEAIDIVDLVRAHDDRRPCGCKEKHGATHTRSE